MRITITTTTTTTTQHAEGEPDELRRFGFRPEGTPPVSQVESAAGSNGKVASIGSEAAVDEFQQRVQFIRQVLRRLAVPEGQRLLYRALAAAGPDGLPPDELAAQMGRTPKELTGVLGALGRRINGTPGVPQWRNGAIEVFFEFPVRDGTFHYVMRPELRQALEMEGLI